MPEDSTNTPSLSFYALSLCACRTTKSERVGQPVNVNVDVDISVEVLTAWSSDEANQKGLAIAMDKWPESEGWRGHSVAAGCMDKQFLEETLIEMDEAAISKSVEEAAQLIM
jgi:hypothetical protein